MQASSAWGAWALHLVLLKALLYLLGVAASVPVLELACYAGYPFVAVCMSMAVGIPFGESQPRLTPNRAEAGGSLWKLKDI